MMKIPIFFLAIFFSSFLHSQAPLKNLDIGDVVPDVEVTSVINFSRKAFKLSEFKGKLLIIDFWATWCSPCIAAFPKLDSLQKKYGNKIQILPVTYEDKNLVAVFLDRFRNLKKVLVPSVTNDRILGSLFKHTTVPHCVWIDDTGKVIAITEGEEVNESNLEKVLRKEAVAFRVKKDVRNIVNETDVGNPIFMPGVKVKNEGKVENRLLAGENVFMHSTLVGAVEGIGPGTYVDSTLVGVMNSTIAWLYRVALWKHGVEILNESKTITTIEDEDLYEKITCTRKKDGGRLVSAGMEYMDWLKANGYSYELKVPNNLSEQKFDLMLVDLNNYFGAKYGIEGVIEKRITKCLALTRTTTVDKLVAKGGEPTIEISKLSLEVRNYNMDVLVAYLGQPLQLLPPIVNKTGYKGKIDIQLNCVLSDLTALNGELSKYGLQLQEMELVQDIGVIRAKKN